MILKKLNPDVLHVIVSYLASYPNSTAFILSLAQTCRSFYVVARPFIPSTLYLEISSNKYKLLRRTLNEGPSYGLGVQSLNIQASKTRQQVTEAEMFEFLQQLPNLTTLFALNPNFSIHIVPIILSPELQVRRSLQKLLLSDRELTALQLLDITRLPRLQYLLVRLMTDLNESEGELHSMKSSNNLQSLKFRHSQIHFQTLLQIMSSAKSLHALSCTAPLHGPVTPSVLPGEISIAANFSPSKILLSLILVSQTLVNLEMHTNGQEWAGHDGTRLDLSDFTALRTISTSAELFLTPVSLKISRDGLFRLLPNSLRKLKLTFPFSIGIFYPVYNRSALDEVGRREFLEQRMDPVSYQWILELAVHKADSFPHLKAVSMWEKARERDALFSNEEWKYPFDVKRLFEEEGINLEVVARGANRGYDSS